VVPHHPQERRRVAADHGSGVTTAMRRAAELAHVLFESQGWTWHKETVPPTIDQIEASYRRLANQVVGETTSCASGRLRVSRNDVDGLDYHIDVGSTGYGEEYPA
jgi:hypothetical protein